MGEVARDAGPSGDQADAAFLRAVLDYTNDLILVLEADGTIRFVSASARWLLGLEPTEHIGGSAFDFIHPDDLADAVAALGRSVAAGAGPLPRKVLRVRHGDGSWRWCELASYGLLEHPLVRGFVVTVREVTGRLDAEARFRAMLANASDIIAVIGTDAKIRWSSAARTRLLGYPSGETDPENAGTELVHPDDLPAVKEAFREVLAGTRGPDVPIVSRVRASDGSWHSLEMMATNLMDDPNVGGVVINARDVTDRMEMERRLRAMAKELERSNTELERFASIAAHDLQEPLRTVAGFARLLQRSHNDRLDEEGREFVDCILESASRMQHLINDLLAYSRVGRQELRLGPVDVNALVGEVKRSLVRSVEDTQTDLVAGPLPTVYGDARQLESVLQNLITNAIKFHGPDPPRIEISAAKDQDQWSFSVADNGIGIDPKHGERIFAVFQRLHTREEYEGTGMGLAICQRVIERHGGRIWFEPRPAGGSVFRFTLPGGGPTGLA